jgi:hypothetical protein
LAVFGDTQATVRFQLRASLRGFVPDPDAEPHEFLVPDKHNGTVVRIRPKTEEERKKDSSFSGRAEAEAEFDPKPEIAAALASLEAGQLPEGSLPRGEWPREFDFIRESGELEDGHIAPGPILSASLQDFLSETRNGLAFSLRFAVGVLRWRLGHAGPLDPVSVLRVAWSSNDSENWHIFPRKTSGRLVRMDIPEITREVSKDVQGLVDQLTLEPLAHELWREAWDQRRTNPRSAMLIGMAALEVGIKQFAARRIPDAGWLLAEAPAPNVARLLSEFLPGLPHGDGGPFKAPDAETLATVKKGTTIRNEVTHKGVRRIQPETLRIVLETVRQLLWQMDAASGLTWAEDLRQAKTK